MLLGATPSLACGGTSDAQITSRPVSGDDRDPHPLVAKPATEWPAFTSAQQRTQSKCSWPWSRRNPRTRDVRFRRSDGPRSGRLLGDQRVARHAGELMTALACRAISMLSAITTSPKGSPGRHRPQARRRSHHGADRSAEREFGPSRRLAGPSGACSTAERNPRLSRRSTRLASRGGRRG